MRHARFFGAGERTVEFDLLKKFINMHLKEEMMLLLSRYRQMVHFQIWCINTNGGVYGKEQF